MNKRPTALWVLLCVLVFQGISAIPPGLLLVLDPAGGLMTMPLSMLHGSPFHDFLIPGLILCIVLGLGALLVAAGLLLLPAWSWAEKIALRLAGLPARATVLDVATGPGFLLVELGRRLPGTRLIAQDQAEPMLAMARGELEGAGLRAETVCCRAEHLELGDGSTDVVVCKQLLHEAADVDRVLAEALRVRLIERIVVATSLTHYGFWRRYRAPRKSMAVSSADVPASVQADGQDDARSEDSCP